MLQTQEEPVMVPVTWTSSVSTIIEKQCFKIQGVVVCVTNLIRSTGKSSNH